MMVDTGSMLVSISLVAKISMMVRLVLGTRIGGVECPAGAPVFTGSTAVPDLGAGTIHGGLYSYLN